MDDDGRDPAGRSQKSDRSPNGDAPGEPRTPTERELRYRDGMMGEADTATPFTGAARAQHSPARGRRGGPTAEDLLGQGFLKGLASNGGFEDAEAGWTVHLTNHVAYTDTSAGPTKTHSGLRVLECNTTAVNDDMQDNLLRDGPGVPAGTRVTLRTFVRQRGSGSGSARSSARW
jgi:hypothetical protein